MEEAKEKKERVENPAVREFIYKFAPEVLERNPIFLQVFGKRFATRRIKSSLIVAYTNESVGPKGYVGYHMSSEKSITICDSENSENLLTPAEIENDRKIQEIVLHEAIHAILDFTASECRKYKILSGTGILKRYKNENGSIVELGRGLNEGYTEWLCEKCGYEAPAYGELTNFVRLIEQALGPEKTMELGKGNFGDRYSKLFGMDGTEVNRYLSLADSVYKADDELKQIYDFKKYLEERKKYYSLSDEEQKSRKLPGYPNTSAYIAREEKYKKDPGYKLYLKEKGLKHTPETLYEYVKGPLIASNRDSKQISIIMFESDFINHYFKDFLENAFAEETISKENFEKVRKIVSCLNTDLYNIPEIFKYMEPEMTSVTIQKEYKKYLERYISQTVKIEAEKYKRGELAIKNFIGNAKNICDYYNDAKGFLENFATAIEPDFSEDLTRILDIAWRFSDSEEYLKALVDATAYKLVSKDPELGLSTSIIYDSQNFCNRYGFGTNIVRTPNGKAEFDFTSTMENEYEIAMKNFLKLRDEVFSKNPHAQIHIVSKEIVVQNGDDFSFYLISKGEIIPMRVEKESKLQFLYEDRQQETVIDEHPVVQPKVGFWANIRNKLKRIIHDHKNKDNSDVANYTTDKQTRTTLDDYRVEDYDKRLKQHKTQSKPKSIDQKDLGEK